MPRKKTPRRPKKQNQQYLTLNAAIGIVGVLLLGFIYSFSQNSLHRGIPIEVNFPKSDEPRRLAAEIHDLNPCLLYTSPSPRDATLSRMPSSA